MQLILCDHCGSRDAAASDVLVSVTRAVPKDRQGTRGPKSSREPVGSAPVQLCEPCTERLNLFIGRAVQDVREGRGTLPELETEEVDLTSPEAPAEHQEALPMDPPAIAEDAAWTDTGNPGEKVRGKRHRA